MFGLLDGRPKVLNLEAKLACGRDRWVYGEVELDVFEGGGYRLEIELTAPGRRFPSGLEMFVDGAFIGRFDAPHGRRNEFVRSDRDGPLGFAPRIGQTVDLRTDGETVVSGVFAPD